VYVVVTAESVLEILELLGSSGIYVCLDGGWGVDALLGAPSRRHEDLDVVVRLDEVARIRELLGTHGFTLSENELPTRFVMRDPDGRQIDFHPVTFDAEGGGTQRLQSGAAFRYTPEGLRGSGSILSRPVRCLTPELQMLCHMGYEPDAADLHDVALLHERFGLPLPPGYSDVAAEGE
jgi:lincosamide nucleotidyltransferase A/C/D/E